MQNVILQKAHVFVKSCARDRSGTPQGVEIREAISQTRGVEAESPTRYLPVVGGALMYKLVSNYDIIYYTQEIAKLCAISSSHQ
ncbi:hypothetical protein [Spirochaeta dissipatitropha]